MSDHIRTGEVKSMGEGGSAGEVTYDERISLDEVTRRLQRLNDIRDDLEAAVAAVKALQIDAQDLLDERITMKETLAALHIDKVAAEALLRLPESSLARLLDRATAGGRMRGRIEGAVLGLLTGAASGFWRKQAAKF